MCEDPPGCSTPSWYKQRKQTETVTEVENKNRTSYSQNLNSSKHCIFPVQSAAGDVSEIHDETQTVVFVKRRGERYKKPSPSCIYSRFVQVENVTEWHQRRQIQSVCAEKN